MGDVSDARRVPGGRKWLRVVVVVLALLVPVEMCAVPCAAMAVESVEYDVVDSGLRPSSVVLERVAPVVLPVSWGVGGALPVPSAPVAVHPPSPGAPYGILAVRCVVMRC